MAVTTANYVWQVPYAVHHYGDRWDALPGLSVPLLVTGLWFAVSVAAAAAGRRGGRASLAAFLVTEVAFYVLHNATGAYARDLPLGDPVLLVASLLGYASTVTAVVYLALMGRRRRPATARHARRWSVATFAAIDLHGASGTDRRRRLVLAEFTLGTLAMVGLGGFLLSRGGWWWGAWLLGCALNYAALAAHALPLRTPQRLRAAVAGMDVLAELRRYSPAQALLLVPGAVAVAAVLQRMAD